MVRIITNTIRPRTEFLISRAKFNIRPITETKEVVSQKAKILAWAIFLIFFFESGTLGLIPKQLYMIYRNMRISDILIYSCIIYSLFNIKEFEYLFKSKTLIISKLLIIYLSCVFIGSVIFYGQNPIEYFFRLKGVWSSAMIFPFLLLIHRNGFNYFIKLVFPVAVVSNILYILSAVTGVAFMPGLEIVKQTLPGGMQVNRVFGGTFFGEYFFLGFIYNWVTKKFKPYQLILAVLFVTPHILAFGRSAWANLSFIIVFIVFWNLLRKKNFKIIFRQAVLLIILLIVIIYGFMKFIPQSDFLLEAIGARVSQGEEDMKYTEGTYGSRITNTQALIDLWKNTNILFGIGMHPMWVIKAETVEENIYAWGFNDIRWPAILAAYGLVGFLLSIVFQIYYFVVSLKILKNNKEIDICTFFIILLCAGLFFDTVFNFSIVMVSTTLSGILINLTLAIAMVTYKYEQLKHPDHYKSNVLDNVSGDYLHPVSIK